MSLLSKNSPKKMRQDMAKPIDTFKDETPIQAIKEEKEQVSITEQPNQKKEVKELVDIYAYKPPEFKSEKTITKPIEPVASNKLTRPKVSLYDLAFFCEERIHRILYEPLDTKKLKVDKIQRDFYKDTLEVYAEYKENIKVAMVNDILYYRDGLPLIHEDQYLVTGFLRKYLDIKEVLIMFRTGEILKRESKFCNFWYDDRLSKLTEFNPAAISKPEMLAEKNCLKCNLTCPFRQQQQIRN